MYKNKAFTLVEVLVTMVISGIVFSSVMVSYFSFTQMNRKIYLWRKLQKETNFAMIRMTDKIREYSIDYEAYKSGDCRDEGYYPIDSNTLLCVGDKNDQFNHKFEKVNNSLIMDGQPLFSDLFSVDQLLFFNITPECDPLDPDLENNCPTADYKEINIQPKITVLMTVSSRDIPDITMTLQTTISARVYDF